jgi:uncharacterized RDD family membrane protein YckC
MLNSYYILENGQEIGPFSHTDLMEKEILPDALLLSPISNEWQSAAYLPEFYDYFQSKGIYYPVAGIRASFWWRLLAYIIDYVLLFMAVVALGIAYDLIMRFTGGPLFSEINEKNIGFRLALAAAMIIYNAGFEATKMQGSIGKTICKLKVVNAEGQRISFSNALGRNAAKIISSLVCGMGFLNILWDSKRQGWHDQMAKTYVIRRP